MEWNELASPLSENPTKSSEVNGLITWIKKKEISKEGSKPSKKHCPLQAEEFKFIMDTAENSMMKSSHTLP